MAQEINDTIAWIPAALMSQIAFADTATSGRQTGGPSTPGDYRLFRGTLHSGTATIDVAAGLTSGQWNVTPGQNPGELSFAFSAYGDLNGGNPTKWQYSLNSGSSWADVPGSDGAGALGTYTVTGLTGGTVYTGTIKVRLITTVGDGAASVDSKSATVPAAATNLIDNGTFATGSNWQITGAPTVAINTSLGTLVFNGAGFGARADQPLLGGELAPGNYAWALDISGYSAGAVRLTFRTSGNSLLAQTAQLSGDGAKGGTIAIPAGCTKVSIRADANPTTLSVDNVSLTAA